MLTVRHGPPGENMAFEKVCKCCDALQEPVRTRHARPIMLKKLWEDYGKGEHDIFPLMRLLLPHLDTSRPMYRAKQKQLANMYVSHLSLDPEHADAQAMLNWKRPSSGFQRTEQGNFPEVVFDAIKRRTKTRAQLPEPVTIAQLNRLLDDFARADDLAKKTKVLGEMFSKMTALEQKWMLRIVIKDMNIGIKENSIFNLLHPDAQELYNSVCDLQSTCRQCSDPSFRLDQISLQLFRPVKPRLSARGSWVDIAKYVGKKGPIVVEYKLDGERVVLHWQVRAAASPQTPRHSHPATHAWPHAPPASRAAQRGKNGEEDRVQWWTRNCKDFTHNYREAMAPVLNECVVPSSVESIILDGEMMVWDCKTGDYSPFGENRCAPSHKAPR